MMHGTAEWRIHIFTEHKMVRPVAGDGLVGNPIKAPGINSGQSD